MCDQPSNIPEEIAPADAEPVEATAETTVEASTEATAEATVETTTETPVEILPVPVPSPSFLDSLTDKISRLFASKTAQWIGGHLLQFSILVVALAAAVAAISILISNLNPTLTLAKAVDKTNAAMASRIEDSPYSALFLLTQALSDGTVALTGAQDHNQFQLDLVSNQKNQAHSATLTYDLDGDNGTCAAFLSPSAMAFTADFTSESYGITFDGFTRDLEDSFVSDDMSDDEIETLSSMVSALEHLTGWDGETLRQPYEACLTDFIQDLDFDKETDTVKVNTQRITCKTYTTTMDEDDIEDLMEDIFRIMEQDTTLEQAYILMATTDGSHYDARQLDSLYQDYVEDLQDSFEYFWDNSDLELDWELVFYVANGYVVKWELNGDTEMYGQSSDLDITMILGENPLTDDWKLTVKTAEQTWIANYASQWENAVFTDSCTVEDNNSQLGWKTQWDEDDGSLTVKVDDGSETLRYKGTLAFSKNGFTLFSNKFYDTALTLNVSDNNKVNTFSYLNIDQWDEEDWEDDWRQVEEALTKAFFLAQ